MTDVEVDVFTGIEVIAQLGSPGTPGQGVPVGGTTGQVLVKNSATAYDASWSLIDTPQIADDAITPDQLATDSVTAAAIAALAVGTSELADNAVTLAKMADIASQTILGRATAGTSDPEALTASQVLAILGIDGVSAAADDAVLRGDGAGGIQSGPVTISDAGAVAGVVGLTMTGTLSGVDATLSGTLSADTIAEVTAAAGVTIDSVELKDGGVTLAAAAALEADTIRAVGAGTDVTVDDNLIVTGNLTVNGSATQIDTEITLQDALTKHADGNGADTLDIGFFGEYDEGAGARYAGWFRDASDGKWKLFDSLQAEPTTTVNILGTGYAAAEVVFGAVEAASATLSGTLSVDTIAEATADAGVTIDGVLVKDGSLTFGTSDILLFSSGSSATVIRSASAENIIALQGSAGTNLGLLRSNASIPLDIINPAGSVSITSFSPTAVTLSAGIDLTLNGGSVVDFSGLLSIGTDTLIDASLEVNLDVDTNATYQVNGTQVVELRKTGWVAPTGTATRTTFDTTTVTTAQLAERVHALIDDLTSHGLIGT